MKGKVQHLSGICSKCRKGDKNILFHRCNRIFIYLDYLDQPKQFISSKDRGKPFENNLDAWKYLDEIQPQVEAEIFIPWNYRGKAKSETLFENFFDTLNKFPTYKKYFESLLHLDLAQIDRIAIKRFQLKLKNQNNPQSASSRNVVMRILKATIAEAAEVGFITSVPTFPKKEKEETYTKNFLTPEEQREVINALPKNYQLLFTFLACHGKRVSEALSLQWENMDLKQKIFRIYEAKVKTEQRLPIHEKFLKALPVAGAINKKGLVFHQWTNSTLNLNLSRACKKAGIKEVTTHEFGRHSFISNRIALFSNTEIALVTNNFSNLQKYEHLDQERIRKIINAI